MCSAPAKERAASDQRRKRLIQLNGLLQNPETSSRNFGGLMKESLALLEKEHLPLTAVMFFVAFMNVYYDAGDIVSAIKWGEKAYEYMAAFDELDSPLMQEARENLERLRMERDGV